MSDFEPVIELVASTLQDQRTPEVEREALASAVEMLVETWRSERERWHRSGVAPFN